MFSIENADSNQPDHLGMFFNILHSQSYGKFGLDTKILYFFVFRRGIYTVLVFSFLQLMGWFVLRSCKSLDGLRKELVFKQIKLNEMILTL